MPKFGASLTGIARVVIYYCNIFTIQANVAELSTLKVGVPVHAMQSHSLQKQASLKFENLDETNLSLFFAFVLPWYSLSHRSSIMLPECSLEQYSSGIIYNYIVFAESLITIAIMFKVQAIKVTFMIASHPFTIVRIFIEQTIEPALNQ
jgi:hypothetical protein